MIFTEMQLVECQLAPHIRPGTLRHTAYVTQLFQEIERKTIEEIQRENPKLIAFDYSQISHMILSKKSTFFYRKMTLELGSRERTQYNVVSFWTHYGSSDLVKTIWPDQVLAALMPVLEGKMTLSDDPWKNPAA